MNTKGNEIRRKKLVLMLTEAAFRTVRSIFNETERNLPQVHVLVQHLDTCHEHHERGDPANGKGIEPASP